MGKLLFVNTNRVNGIAGVIICAAIVLIGAWLGIDGTYAGFLLVPAGLFGGKFSLQLATRRSEIYEQGFVTKDCFGSVSARYADLKGISRYAVRVNGVLNTNVYFSTQSGEKAILTREALRNDDKMEQLIGHACEALAGTWMKTLERQKEVAWIMDGTNPILRIRKDGIIFQGKTGTEEFIALNELQLKAKYPGTVDVCRGATKVTNVSSASSNYFVGETLIAMLNENRQHTAGTELAMAARAPNSMA
jgi:hypothetical protein